MSPTKISEDSNEKIWNKEIANLFVDKTPLASMNKNNGKAMVDSEVREEQTSNGGSGSDKENEIAKAESSTIEKEKDEDLKNNEINSKIDELIYSAIYSSDSDEELYENSFINSMAEEGEEDTPSEGSNDIVEIGEDINTTESELSTDESYERDSFIDDGDNYQLLSGEEYDLSIDDGKKKSRIIQLSSGSDDSIVPLSKFKKEKKIQKRKKSRIIRLEDSSDEESNQLITQNGLPSEKSKDTDIQNELVNEKSGDPVTQNENEVVSDKENVDFNTSGHSLKSSTLDEINTNKKFVILENIKVQDISNQELVKNVVTAINSFCSETSFRISNSPDSADPVESAEEGTPEVIQSSSDEEDVITGEDTPKVIQSSSEEENVITEEEGTPEVIQVSFQEENVITEESTPEVIQSSSGEENVITEEEGTPEVIQASFQEENVITEEGTPEVIQSSSDEENLVTEEGTPEVIQKGSEEENVITEEEGTPEVIQVNFQEENVITEESTPEVIQSSSDEENLVTEEGTPEVIQVSFQEENVITEESTPEVIQSGSGEKNVTNKKKTRRKRTNGKHNSINLKLSPKPSTSLNESILGEGTPEDIQSNFEEKNMKSKKKSRRKRPNRKQNSEQLQLAMKSSTNLDHVLRADASESIQSHSEEQTVKNKKSRRQHNSRNFQLKPFSPNQSVHRNDSKFESEKSPTISHFKDRKSGKKRKLRDCSEDNGLMTKKRKFKDEPTLNSNILGEAIVSHYKERPLFLSPGLLNENNNQQSRKAERTTVAKKAKTKHFHPKDFRSAMLYDNSRVTRIETRKLLKKNI